MALVWVFLVGGFFCLLGQVLVDHTKLTSARILVLFVVAGAVLEGLGIYEPLRDLAQCGATVPIIGFGATFTKGALEAVEQQGLLGVCTGPLQAAAGGIGFVILIAFFCALLFSPKEKK